MINRILYIIVLLFTTSVTMAQNNAIFNGGSADGHDRTCYQQNTAITVDFSGGNGDGHSTDCYQQSTPLTITFTGGSADGHAMDCYQQTTPVTVAFSGGNGDGYSRDCYTQSSNLNPIFSGGIGGDGMLNGCANEPLGCTLAIALGNDTTFCNGQTLTLDAGAFPGGATYLWQDSSANQTFVVDTTGLYYVFVTDTGGCTGVDSINVTVNPVPVVDLGNDTAFCDGNNLVLDAGNAGATYVWQNTATPPFQNQTFTVNTSGTYYVTASFGTCSDTDSIEVTVNPIVTTNLTDSVICNGDSALIFGNYETVAGTYRDTITASTGCDSILVQQLIVNPTYNNNLGTVTICQGDSALILGNYETVAGMYSDTLQSINGCDSIVSQTLNVDPAHIFSLGNDTAFCAGNSLTLDAGAGATSYLWMNNPIPSHQNQTFTVSATGTYYVETTIGACTTTDTINVTVHPNQNTNLTDSVICQGDSALIFGTYQSVAGTYYDSLQTTNGCDSILIQQLVVNPSYNNNLGTVSICAGDSALIFGNYETVAGVYYDSTQTINGCDSIVEQTLAVLTNTSVNLGNDTAICQGESITLDAGAGGSSYLWMNNPIPSHQNQTFTVNATGTYFVEVTTGSCYATDTINVTVNPVVTTNLADSIICNGDSALIFGNYQIVAGTYRDTITASTGCDSILVQQLIVNPTYNNNLGTVTICQGDSAMIFGNYETVAGTYSDTLQSINGCDSIVSQTLNVDPAHIFSLGNDTAFCAGNSLTLDAGAGATSYLWMNNPIPSHQNQTFTVSATGTYYVTATIGVCSTTDSIDVTVIQPVFTNLTDSVICQGDSSLIFGNYETVAGNYYDTLTSVATGCDSILVQQLVVNPTYNNNLGTISICQGDSAMILGNYESVAGTYTDTLQSINGCDSIVSQTLNIDPTPIVDLGNDTTFCSGNSLTLDAGSGATSYLWMNNPIPSHQNQTFTVSTTGTYYVTATIGVCSATDSIDVTVIQPIFTNYTDLVICAGDSALIFGSYETVAGNYYDTLTSVITGCDSILVQQLVVNPIYNNNLGTISICAGDSALILGNYETVAGTYTDTLQSINGCDSIVSQTLNVDPIPVVDLGNDTTFCSGNSLTLDAGSGATSYLWMNNPIPSHQNQTFTVSTTGTYYVTATIGVCSATDSIDVIVIQPVFTNLTDINICSGDSANIFGNFETVAGTYYDTLVASATMCDSILVQELLVNPNVSTNDSTTICNGDSILLGGAFQTLAGTYYDTLQTSVGCDSLLITELSVVNGFTTNLADTICEGESLFVGGALQTTTGVYYDSLQSVSGCDSLVITNLLVTPMPTVIVTAEPTIIAAGESSQLNATGGGTYNWTPNSSLNCSTCANPIASPTETTLYTVTVDSNGCVVSDTVTVSVDDEFFIPEGFSPNGDGVNDVFEIVGIAKYPNNSITIINRWGSKVFEAAPYKADWNGTNQFGVSFGDDLPSGTYFYILNLGKEGPNGEQEIKGYIYLNR